MLGRVALRELVIETPPRADAVARPRTALAWLIPSLLYVCAIAGELANDTHAASGFVFSDETFYKLAALGFSRGDASQILKLPYPPLYPLVITPAFFFGDAWYEWILRINAVVGSLLVFPVWAIARRYVALLPATLCAAIALLLPYGLVYQRMLMSENLFVPLFLLSLLVLLATVNSPSRRHAVLLGLTWGLCLLTRHIFVSMLPLMTCLWYVLPRFDPGGVEPHWMGTRLRLLAWLALGVAVAYVPWLLFNALHGVSLLHAIGVGIPFKLIDEHQVTDDELRASFVGWVGTYAATVVLLYAPYLAVLGQWRAWTRKWFSSEQTFMLLLTLTATCLLALTAFTVMWKYFASRWAESYIEERYLMYFLPVLPILTIVAFKRLRAQPPGRPQLAVVAFVAAALVLLSFGLIVDNTVWPQHPFSSNPQSSAQLLAFHAPIGPLGSGGLIAIVLVASVAIAATLRRFPNAALGVWFASAFAFYGISDRAASDAMDNLQSSAGLGRAIASVIDSGQARSASGPIQIYVDPAVKDLPPNLDQVVNFWGVPTDAFGFAQTQTASEGIARPEGLLISHTVFADPVADYTASGSRFYIYRQPVHLVGQLRIQSVNPSSVKAGAQFNVQPDGESAGWIASENATSATVVVINDRPVDTVVSNPRLVTFLVPKVVLNAPGSYTVYLMDRQTGARSNALQFDVTL